MKVHVVRKHLNMATLIIPPIFKKSEPDLDVVHNCPEASSLHIAINLIVSSEILSSLYAE